jgi:hypothetical protein
MSIPQHHRPGTCPPWCELGHGATVGEEDQVHVGGQLCVRNTLIRLCASVDPVSGTYDGPYVIVGSHEYTLAEVDALVAALTSLAAQAREATPLAEA